MAITLALSIHLLPWCPLRALCDIFVEQMNLIALANEPVEFGPECKQLAKGFLSLKFLFP